LKAAELTEKLIAEGCNSRSFAVLGRQSDAFCLDKRGNEWVVFYSERGVDAAPIFRSNFESEACNFFFEYVLNLEHWHLVGWFKEEAGAESLEEKLAELGIPFVRNDIPAYKHANDRRYRVFVVGKDIFKYRQALGEPEIRRE